MTDSRDEPERFGDRDLPDVRGVIPTATPERIAGSPVRADTKDGARARRLVLPEVLPNAIQRAVGVYPARAVRSGARSSAGSRCRSRGRVEGASPPCTIGRLLRIAAGGASLRAWRWGGGAWWPAVRARRRLGGARQGVGASGVGASGGAPRNGGRTGSGGSGGGGGRWPRGEGRPVAIGTRRGAFTHSRTSGRLARPGPDGGSCGIIVRKRGAPAPGGGRRATRFGLARGVGERAPATDGPQMTPGGAV
jgi:hypothetical protein